MIGILGCGTWAIGIASVLLENDQNIVMWGRDKAQTDALRADGKNPKYPMECELKGKIQFTNDITTMFGLDYLINAIPTQHIRSVFQILPPQNKGTVIINVSKGIEIGSQKFISDIVSEFLPENTYAALSGPSHAEEVALKIPTALVAACKDKEVAKDIQLLFSTPTLRVYTNDDVIGVELSSALKNIIALGTGICDGLKLGDNTKAAIMTRGMTEIKRLGKALGAKEKTFNGLAGIGDLIVTCTSMHSRNRRCGILLGGGLSLKEATKRIGMAVEGVSTVKAAISLAKKHKVEMPITEALYSILYEGLKPELVASDLMKRDLKHEFI